MSNFAESKILTLEALGAFVRDQQRQTRRVALCHGCFDILHVGHVRHFEFARGASDVLVVTITPDRFIDKGPGRPVFPAGERAELVAALKAVSAVAINQWASAVELIELIKPDLFAKGEEYEVSPETVNAQFVEEAAAVKRVGGEVLFTRGLRSSSSGAFERIQAGNL